MPRMILSSEWVTSTLTEEDGSHRRWKKFHITNDRLESLDMTYFPDSGEIWIDTEDSEQGFNFTPKQVPELLGLLTSMLMEFAPKAVEPA